MAVTPITNIAAGTAPSSPANEVNPTGYVGTPPAGAALIKSSPSTTQTTNPASTTVGMNSGGTSTQPVVTATAAQEDYNQKYATWQYLQSQVANQAVGVQQQNAQAAADQAKQAADAAQLALQQQQTQNDTTAANAKAAAVTAATSPQQTGTTNTGSSYTPTAPGGNVTNTGSIPIPQAPDTTQSAYNYTQGLNTAVNQYSGKLQDIYAQKDTLTTNMTNSLNSLMQGTFPLSAPQSALLTALTNQLNQNVAFQQVANSSYVGQVTEAAYRNGGAYTPGQMAAQINNAVQTGVAKVQALDNSAATTMAQLEQSFQQQDFQLVNESYNVLTTQLNDKATAITDTYNAVTSTMKNQYDAVTAAAQQSFTDQMSSANFNMTEAQNANDNMFKQQQITETQWKDNQDVINQRAQTAISAYNAGLTGGATYNPSTGTVTTSDGNVTDPSTLPGGSKLPNGTTIITHPNGDSFYVNSTGEVTKFSSAAAASTFTTGSQTSNTLNQMQVLFNQINSITGGNNLFTKGVGNIANSLGGAMGIGNTNLISQYNSLKATLPANLQTSAPNISQFPVLGAFTTTGTNSGNNWFISQYQSINTSLSAAAPGAPIPIFGQTFATESDAAIWAQKSGMTTTLNNIITSYPQYANNAQAILTIINTGNPPLQ